MKININSLRIKAILIDYGIAFLILIFIEFVFNISGYTERYLFKTDEYYSFIIIIILNVLFILKDITGASPGKKLMKLKIVKNDNTETKPSIILLILRNVFLSLGLIELLVMLLRKDNRRLGDLVTNSRVIYLK